MELYSWSATSGPLFHHSPLCVWQYSRTLVLQPLLGSSSHTKVPSFWSQICFLLTVKGEAFVSTCRGGVLLFWKRQCQDVTPLHGSRSPRETRLTEALDGSMFHSHKGNTQPAQLQQWESTPTPAAETGCWSVSSHSSHTSGEEPSSLLPTAGTLVGVPKYQLRCGLNRTKEYVIRQGIMFLHKPWVIHGWKTLNTW